MVYTFISTLIAQLLEWSFTSGPAGAVVDVIRAIILRQIRSFYGFLPVKAYFVVAR